MERREKNCRNHQWEDEGNKAETSPLQTFSLTVEDQEKQLEMMANINQENWETEKGMNDSLRKEHLDEGDIVEIQREKHASEQEEHSHQDWEIDIKSFIINNQGHPISGRCCIYRAHMLRDVDSAAFTPKVVSIGPLHHFQKYLIGMEETKIKYLEQFLHHAAKTARLGAQEGLNSREGKLEFLCWTDIDQIERDNDFSCLGKFLSILKSSENDIRSSYAENLNHIASKEFLRLILVDAAFIIELFLRDHFDSDEKTLLSRDYLFISIRRDLWLLENQLPFFVIQELYDSAFGSYPDIYPPFLELACKYFSRYNEQEKSIIGEVNHFSDLLRTFFLPSSGKFEEKEQNSNEDGDELLGEEFGFGTIVPLLEHLPSATQLHAAGVIFSASKRKCLLDIKFFKGRLEMPSLHIGEEARDLYRNLIALEQYHYPTETLISDYFIFMDYLLDTSKDADLLAEKKIIKHWLGSSSEVASLFNSLCAHIIKGKINGRYSRIISELNKYHDQPWHRWKATLWSQYFSTPWRSASTTAAIILLVLTLAQTILAVFAL